MEHRLTILETEHAQNVKAIEALTVQVTELNESLNKYRGAWGMLLMVGAAITAAVTIWLEYLRN
jgi:uncharacterized coiled-coil protein SlyX